MVPLSLADAIDVAPADRLTFACTTPELDGEANLVLRAARAVADAAGCDVCARLTLSKRIPQQAGLGGGSSDAAAVLLAAMQGRFGPMPAIDWLAVARSLGSDVPFFLAGSAALVEGTGERVTPLGAAPPWAVLLVKPPNGSSTAEAYAMLDDRPRPARARSESSSIACAKALQRADYDAVLALLENDFTEVALLQTQVRQAADALQAAGARRPLLAGSGSTVFALVRTQEERDAIAACLRVPAGFTVLRTTFDATPGWRTETSA